MHLHVRLSPEMEDLLYELLKAKGRASVSELAAELLVKWTNEAQREHSLDKRVSLLEQCVSRLEHMFSDGAGK